MKTIILIGCLLVATNCYAQKGKEYKASNGITYHLKDTITMSKGSGTDAKFLYLGRTGLSAAMSYNSNASADQLLADRAFAGGKGVIEKIKEIKFAGVIKPYFVLNFHQGSNYALYIEDAIKACEVTPCIK